MKSQRGYKPNHGGGKDYHDGYEPHPMTAMKAKATMDGYEGYAVDYYEGQGYHGGKGGKGKRAGGRVRRMTCNNDYESYAQKLNSLRENLPENALKAYDALKLALQHHTTLHGSRPGLKRGFDHNLTLAFPDAWKIIARQSGSWNQWEVKVNDGPAMCCCVRLEVLSDDPTIIQDIRSKAKIVKDTLLEDNAKWKRLLWQEGGGFPRNPLSLFKKECASRLGMEPGFGKGNSNRPSNTLVHKGENGQSGGGAGEMSHILSKRVVATFCCEKCRHSWTSHHARLRPDGETIMCQSCSKCSADGKAKDWRMNEDIPMDFAGSKKQQGMHQDDLCGACREFGNCMGVSYDPFILTIAISLMSRQNVQWKSSWIDILDLLIADLGTGFNDLKVCLVPHVYVADTRPPLRGQGDTRPPLRGQGKSYDGPDHNYPSKGGWDAGGSNGDSGGSKDRKLRSTVVVLDEKLYADFLRNGGFAFRQRGAVPTSPVPPNSRAARGSSPQMPSANSGTRHDRQQCEAPGMTGSSARMPQANSAERNRSPGNSAAPAEERMPADAQDATSMPNPFKNSKIGGGGAVPAPAPAPASTTPLLDDSPPVRRAQILQIIRRLALCNTEEELEWALAEKYLVQCGGDHEKTLLMLKLLETPQLRVPAVHDRCWPC
jgi:hypothetical protein